MFGLHKPFLLFAKQLSIKRNGWYRHLIAESRCAASSHLPHTTSKEPLLWLEDDNTSGYSQMEFHATGKIFRVGVGNSDALATYANKFYIVDAGIGRPRLLIGDEVRCRSVLPCSTQRAVANSLYIPYFQYQRSAVSAPGQHVANGNRQWQSALPRCQWKRDTGR